jgi:hypothetical protein
MQPNLTPDEIKFIADLPNHAGWVLFRDLIQATHDNLLDALASAATDEDQKRLYTEWRALRTLLANTHNMEAWAKQLLDQLDQAQQFAQQHQGIFQNPDTQMAAPEYQQMMSHLRGGADPRQQQAASSQGPGSLIPMR